VELVEHNPGGGIDYPLKLSKFQNVSTLTIFVAENFGGDCTSISYVGLKGEVTSVGGRGGPLGGSLRHMHGPSPAFDPTHTRPSFFSTLLRCVVLCGAGRRGTAWWSVCTSRLRR
jgi:hypothetical protein